MNDEKLNWFYGPWAFVKDPSGKPFLFVEWHGCEEDADSPKIKRLEVVEARED